MPANRGASMEPHRRIRLAPALDEPGPLEKAIQASYRDMPWMRPTDQGAMELAIQYAKRIDSDESGYLLVKLGPHLLETLRQLGLTVTMRTTLFGNEKILSGKLAELRGKRGA